MLSPDYWSNRYKAGETGWDIGYCSTPLAAYFDQLTNKNLKILIPGCGNAHEAKHLIQLGFKHVYLLDWSKEPLLAFADENPNFPKSQLLNLDFFNLEESFDLIIEQTFFCALDPDLRLNYLKKSKELLNPQGKHVGLLFNCEFENPGPPFGGNLEDYKPLFDEVYSDYKLEPCLNSIPERRGRELFFIAS